MKTSEFWYLNWENLIICEGKLHLVFWQNQVILPFLLFLKKLAFNLKMEAKQWKHTVALTLNGTNKVFYYQNLNENVIIFSVAKYHKYRKEYNM